MATPDPPHSVPLTYHEAREHVRAMADAARAIRRRAKHDQRPLSPRDRFLIGAYFDEIARLKAWAPQETHT